MICFVSGRESIKCLGLISFIAANAVSRWFVNFVQPENVSSNNLCRWLKQALVKKSTLFSNLFTCCLLLKFTHAAPAKFCLKYLIPFQSERTVWAERA